MRARAARRARRPRTLAKKIERTIRLVAVTAAVAAGLWVGFCCIRKTVKPFRLYVAEARENNRIEEEIRRLEKENSTLCERAHYLRTPSGAETEARTLGWVRDGEISLVVERPREEKQNRHQ